MIAFVADVVRHQFACFVQAILAVSAVFCFLHQDLKQLADELVGRTAQDVKWVDNSDIVRKQELIRSKPGFQIFWIEG